MENNSISSKGCVLEYQKISKPTQISRKRKRNQAPVNVSVKKYRCVGTTFLVEDYTLSDTIPEYGNRLHTDVKTVSKVEFQVRVPVAEEEQHLVKPNESILRSDLVPKITPFHERYKGKLKDLSWLRYLSSSNVKFVFLETPQGVVCRDLRRTNALRRHFEKSIYFNKNFPLKFNRKIMQIREKNLRLIQIAVSDIKFYRDERQAWENKIISIEDRFRAIYSGKNIQNEKNDNLDLQPITNQMNSPGDNSPACKNDINMDTAKQSSDAVIQKEKSKDLNILSYRKQMNSTSIERLACGKEFIKNIEKRNALSKSSVIQREDILNHKLPTTRKQNSSRDEIQESKSSKNIKRCRFSQIDIRKKEHKDLELPSITKNMNISRTENLLYEKLKINQSLTCRQTFKEEIINLEALPSTRKQNNSSKEELRVCMIKDTGKLGSISIRRKENKDLEFSSTTKQINSSKRSSFSKSDNVLRKDEDHDLPPMTKQMNFTSKERKAYEKILNKKRGIRRHTLCPCINNQKKEIINLELPTITREMDESYNEIINGEPFEVVVSKFNFNIKRSSIRTLIGLNWLDDEVINFYMNLIMERSELNVNKLPSAYCMNTFFVTRLSVGGYSAVKRWTRKIDLFSKDIIVVPIHMTNNHWIMVIIHMKNKSILCYDSLGNRNQRVLMTLKNYLQEESLDKRKVPFDTSKFLIEKASNAPRQGNGSDCGVFSCMVAEYITRNQMPSFTQEHMPYFRKKMVLEIGESKLWL